MPDPFSKADWRTYYSKKRVEQQWMQLHLLGSTDCETVLEVGPAFGFVTALLVNIGYRVTTLERVPRVFDHPDVPHLEKDICDLHGGEIAGHDAILCCETLEHIAWDRVSAVLSAFRRSGAHCLIVSVPYMGFQVAFDFYLNRTTFRQYFSMKKLSFLKRFVAEPPGGHQWEIGYRGYPLAIWERRLTDCGWTIARRDFTAHCRSVFHLLRPAAA
jgi:16S rRNA A1518/A1519 N6-dimethyltransferase RsmA/KsgA/DIM1 with predicted DNA glycosylase/AP lyase activity